jgi:hypothetical protein
MAFLVYVFACVCLLILSANGRTTGTSLAARSIGAGSRGGFCEIGRLNALFFLVGTIVKLFGGNGDTNESNASYDPYKL